MSHLHMCTSFVTTWRDCIDQSDRLPRMTEEISLRMIILSMMSLCHGNLSLCPGFDRALRLQQEINIIISTCSCLVSSPKNHVVAPWAYEHVKFLRVHAHTTPTHYFYFVCSIFGTMPGNGVFLCDRL